MDSDLEKKTKDYLNKKTKRTYPTNIEVGIPEQIIRADLERYRSDKNMSKQK